MNWKRAAVVAVMEFRDKRNLTQDGFAKKFGLSKGTLRQWEQGVREPSDASALLLKVIVAAPDVVKRVARTIEH